MEIKRITIEDNEPYLRQISKVVDFSDKLYLEDVEQLEKFCVNNAVFALAAVQIGIPKRIIYLRNTTDDVNRNDDSNYNEAKVLINPIIRNRIGHTRYWEGCASCRDANDIYRIGLVDRPYLIEVEYLDLDNRKHVEVFFGFAATVLSHEYDHLDGILHIDKATEIIHMTLEMAREHRKTHPYEVLSMDGKL